MSVKDPIFLRRVELRNYKSIAHCRTELGALTYLVGPNGAGKSNFLDALRFVADSLRTTLDHALRERNGINEVRRRSSGHPTHFRIELVFSLSSGDSGTYGFQVGSRPEAGFEIQWEKCSVRGPEALGPESFFEVKRGAVEKSSVPIPPAAASDRLYLVTVSGVSQFRPIYDALSRMVIYNFNPALIREFQRPDAGDVLLRGGENLASVLAKIEKSQPAAKQRIEEYLSKVVPGVQGVSRKVVASRETLEFRQQVAGAKDAWRFLAASMSDGTLRVLGVLAALLQSQSGGPLRVPLVGIEEPEVALHPGAAGVLRSALEDASLQTQILVTSHSPDLLDDPCVEADSILAVSAEGGNTLIARPDSAGREALKEKLYTAGELLRMNQLIPDPEELKSKQGELDLGTES